tara:strand:+ start:195 stop:725 length:531 start_codon:yes stop_codon:yes gene_type:complete
MNGIKILTMLRFLDLGQNVKKLILLVVLLIVFVFLLLPPPDLEEKYINEFYDNTLVFEKIEDIVCQDVEKIPTLRATPGNLENGGLARLLNKMNVVQIVVKPENQICTITLVRDVLGFAGSGYSYKYRLNVRHPITYDKTVHGVKKNATESLKSGDNTVTYDIHLSNNWYLTYTGS